MGLHNLFGATENIKKYKWFNNEETKGLDHLFAVRLDHARERSWVKYRITSGYRSAQENQEVGGVPDSAHVKGLGVDLAADNSTDRCQILKGLFAVGFKRIGVYDKHIHVDDDKTKPQDVIWIGLSKWKNQIDKTKA